MLPCNLTKIQVSSAANMTHTGRGFHLQSLSSDGLTFDTLTTPWIDPYCLSATEGLRDCEKMMKSWYGSQRSKNVLIIDVWDHQAAVIAICFARQRMGRNDVVGSSPIGNNVDAGVLNDYPYAHHHVILMTLHWHRSPMAPIYHFSDHIKSTLSSKITWLLKIVLEES